MRIPCLTVVTLGVSDLAKATAFYREIFSVAPNTKYEGVPFIELPRAWQSPCPLEKPAEDISPTRSAARANVANRPDTCSGMGSALLHGSRWLLLGSRLGADVRFCRGRFAALQAVNSETRRADGNRARVLEWIAFPPAVAGQVPTFAGCRHLLLQNRFPRE